MKGTENLLRLRVCVLHFCTHYIYKVSCCTSMSTKYDTIGYVNTKFSKSIKFKYDNIY